MPAQSEQILDRSVNVQESLTLSRRLETAHLPFPLPCRLMRYLAPIVRILRRVMRHQRHHRAMCDAITSEFVGHKSERFATLALQESAEEPSRCSPIPARLHEDVDHVSVLVNGTPEVLALTVDGDEQFVQQPDVAEPALAPFQSPGVLGSTLD